MAFFPLTGTPPAMPRAGSFKTGDRDRSKDMDPTSMALMQMGAAILASRGPGLTGIGEGIMSGAEAYGRQREMNDRADDRFANRQLRELGANIQLRGSERADNADTRDQEYQPVRMDLGRAGVANTQANTDNTRFTTRRGMALLPGEIEGQGLTNEGRRIGNAQGIFNLDFDREARPIRMAGLQAGVDQTVAATEGARVNTDRTRTLLPYEVAGADLTNTGRFYANEGADLTNQFARDTYGTRVEQGEANLDQTRTATRNARDANTRAGDLHQGAVTGQALQNERFSLDNTFSRQTLPARAAKEGIFSMSPGQTVGQVNTDPSRPGIFSPGSTYTSPTTANPYTPPPASSFDDYVVIAQQFVPEGVKLDRAATAQIVSAAQELQARNRGLGAVDAIRQVMSGMDLQRTDSRWNPFSSKTVGVTSAPPPAAPPSAAPQGAPQGAPRPTAPPAQSAAPAPGMQPGQRVIQNGWVYQIGPDGKPVAVGRAQ